MKKIALFLLIMCLMTGCGAAETFETIGPIQHLQTVVPSMANIQLSLPDAAAKQTFGSDADTIYECEGYTLVLQTIEGGDLHRTIRSLSGFEPEKLTIMESNIQQGKRYDWVWTAVGESGDMVCRASVLNDGNYHYCMYTVTSAQFAGDLRQEWNALFASFALE